MKAAVVGLGTMGPGIAATLANGGWDVAAFDINPEQVKRAQADLPMAFQVLERARGSSGARRGTVTFGTDLVAAVADCDLVVEAAPERVEIKQAVFRQIDQLTRIDTILASNTSGIPIGTLQSVCAMPERVVGMHWSNPPHVIPVVEVIAGPKTCAHVTESMVKIVNDLGLKSVLVKKDVPGFVHNRLLYALLREAVALVEADVVDPQALDTCFKWALGLKLSVIGPLELLDVAGLDIYQAVAGYLNADLDAGTTVPSYVTDRTKAGKLGLKSGCGVYDYAGEDLGALRAARAAQMIAVLKALEGR